MKGHGQGGAKVGLQLWGQETQFILILLFINYCMDCIALYQEELMKQIQNTLEIYIYLTISTKDRTL